jgi:hypothetical protein
LAEIDAGGKGLGWIKIGWGAQRRIRHKRCVDVTRHKKKLVADAGIDTGKKA